MTTSLYNCEDWVGNIQVTRQDKSLLTLPRRPRILHGNFDCADKPIFNLIGSPEIVHGKFSCWKCHYIQNLEGAPKEVHGHFLCWDCENLISLQGAPSIVTGTFDCWHNTQLKTLEGLPKNIAHLNITSCSQLYVTGFQDITNHVGTISSIHCDIRPQLGELMKVRGLQKIRLEPTNLHQSHDDIIAAICNKHLPLMPSNWFKWKKEMIAAGFEEYI